MKIFSRKKKVEILITLDFKKEIKNKYLNYLGFRNYYKSLLKRKFYKDNPSDFKFCK